MTSHLSPNPFTVKALTCGRVRAGGAEQKEEEPHEGGGASDAAPAGGRAEEDVQIVSSYSLQPQAPPPVVLAPPPAASPQALQVSKPLPPAKRERTIPNILSRSRTAPPGPAPTESE